MVVIFANLYYLYYFIFICIFLSYLLYIILYFVFEITIPHEIHYLKTYIFDQNFKYYMYI